MTDREPDDRCNYVFDPEEWEAATGFESPLSADILDDDGIWRCPHSIHNDRDQCLFHLPPKQTDDVAVRDRFLEQIEQPGRPSKQFIGAQFENLDLDHIIIESADNHPIDLRHASFIGTTTWQYAIIEQPLNFGATTFQSTADFTETRFWNEVYLSKACFEEEARFYGTIFAQGGWFYKATFAEANFHLSSFGDHADLIETQFKRCHFHEAIFEKRVHFDKATFEHASFFGTKFEDDAHFDEASLPERANFRQTHFAAVGSFTELDPFGGTTYINFRNATITSGALVPVADGEIMYDLQDGTIGNVTIAEDSTDADLFAHYRLLNTSFNGFDFGAYRDALNAVDWRIHEIIDIPGLDIENGAGPSAGELESTYLKAKNGANMIGDTKAAAEFFRKEMLYRRHQYVPIFRNPEFGWRRRAIATWRWGSNALLDITSGYGERPSRVVVTSIVVVVSFVGLFSATTLSQPYESSVGYLILSLESFITLVLGGAESIENPWIRLLAQVEGFIGAFLIALFVFALTRSIHR